MFSSNTTQESGGYQIQRSLRFNRADSAYLTRTPASAGNRKTWTWSGWVKRSDIVNRQLLLEQNAGSSDTNYFGFEFSSDAAAPTIAIGGWNTTWRITSQVFRDVSAWYHLVLAVDTTQATANNRIRLYVNGSEITAFSTLNNPTQNADTGINSTGNAAIGASTSGGTSLNGYMTEVNFIDGQALTPSSFGAFDAQTGVWGPIRYAGSYGTNGFYLNFSNNSNTTAATLGADYSGNGNNWTPNNFSVSAGSGNDSLVDVPTNWGVDTGVGGSVRGNYATWNPLVVNRPTLTNGNLDADGSDLKTAISTIGVSTGKWYWEILIRSGTDTPNMGVTSFPNDNADPGVYLGAGRSYVSSGGGGGVYKNYTSTSTVADSDFSNANTAGAVIGFALDCDAGTLAYYVNNVLGHTDTTIATGTLLYPMTCNFNSAANAYRNTSVNFGQRPFAYTAPSGFRALNTQNLPTPTIGATSATQANKYFDATLFTGTGSPLTVVNAGGFQPDLVWTKNRSSVANHLLTNVLSGVSQYLSSNDTTAELTGTQLYTSFNSNGFSMGTSGYPNGAAVVAWQWRANGAGVTNTAGTITSTVSANTTSGFSVATFTGNGVPATFGHGLGVAPAMVIMKNRTQGGVGYNWAVYHKSLPDASYFLDLNLTSAQAINAGIWNSVAPTSTVVTVGTARINNGDLNVAYCFAEVPGYSRFGSYTGNGSSDGPFVFCGFRPAYVLFKNTSATGDWMIWDDTRSPTNVVDDLLYASLSIAEQVYTGLDFTANGFKIRNTSGDFNTNGASYIFAAFAEFPQKFSLAR